LRVFLSEAGAIGLIGGLLGVAIGWGVGKLINLVAQTWLMSGAGGPPDGPPSDVVVTPLWLIAFALAFATLVGVISGIYPALRAANMKPLRALRTE
jgi:putative ABC transport system permease protein